MNDNTLPDDVDPEVREFLTRMAAAAVTHGASEASTFVERRLVAERQRASWAQGGPVMASSEDLRVGTSQTRLRIHRPTNDECLPVLVYIHGGGWTFFSIDTHDRLMREYASRAGCAVVGVDYSLASEARFPRPFMRSRKCSPGSARKGRATALIRRVSQ